MLCLPSANCGSGAAYFLIDLRHVGLEQKSAGGTSIEADGVGCSEVESYRWARCGVIGAAGVGGC